jgi:uncharacterized protein (TIGR02996 family)
VEGGHHLLNRAEALDTQSGALLRFQSDLIMSELKKYYPSNSKADWASTYKVYQDEAGRENYDWSNWTAKRDYLRELFEGQDAAAKLALASVSATGARKAELLAHIAWLDTLVGRTRERHDVEALFQRAIEADPDNVYARLMYAAWLMEYWNFEKDPDGTLSVAVAQMERARPSDAERRWFDAFRLKLLSLPDDLPQADLEMLKIIAGLDPTDLTPSMVADSLRKIVAYLPTAQDDGALVDNPMRSQLRSALSDAELIELVERLGARGFGCSPWSYSCDPDIDVRVTFDFFDAAASLYEQDGQQERATRGYLMAWLARRRANYDGDASLLASVKRSLEASGTPARNVPVVVKVHRDGGFVVGDLITQLNGSNVQSVDDFVEQFGERGHDATDTVTVARDGKVLNIETKGSPFQFVGLTDYVIPERFLSDGRTPSTFAEMHAAWTSQ